MYLKLHKKHKLDVIAHTLTACGVTIWHGMPERIVQDLKANGYKIKKRKHFRKDISKDQPTNLFENQ